MGKYDLCIRIAVLSLFKPTWYPVEFLFIRQRLHTVARL